MQYFALNFRIKKKKEKKNFAKGKVKNVYFTSSSTLQHLLVVTVGLVLDIKQNIVPIHGI